MFFVCIFTLLKAAPISIVIIMILLIGGWVLNLRSSRSTTSMPSRASIVSSYTMILDTHMGLWRKVIIFFFIILGLSSRLVQVTSMISIIYFLMTILHWATLGRRLIIIIVGLRILLLISSSSIFIIGIIATLIWMSPHLLWIIQIFILFFISNK